jgi:hypothetical protein
MGWAHTVNARIFQPAFRAVLGYKLIHVDGVDIGPDIFAYLGLKLFCTVNES